MSYLRFTLPVLLILIGIGCSPDSPPPEKSTSAQTSQANKAADLQKGSGADGALAPTAERTIDTVPRVVSLPSGLKYVVLKNGYGYPAISSQEVWVHYTGWLYDENAENYKGKMFDSSRIKGNLFKFRLGSRMVIAGWDEGIIGMKKGEIRRLTIPPHLGYGEKGKYVVPPNAILIFEVERFKRPR